MKTIPDLVDTDTTLRSGKPEVRLEIDRPRAADLGVSVMDIEQALNTLVAGQVASTFNAGEDQYDVRGARARSSSAAASEGLAQDDRALDRRLRSVGLDEVVRIVPGTGPSSINRINRQRQVTLTGNVLPGGSQAAILAAIEPGRRSNSAWSRATAAGLDRRLQGTGAHRLLLRAGVLADLHLHVHRAGGAVRSFIHPITILLTLPLAVPFGILSLLITDQTVNIFSGLGLLLLFGIVKKNAILQIDHTNGLREAGMKRYDAIIQANRDRLRPILMTTIALVAGMLPLVISQRHRRGHQSLHRRAGGGRAIAVPAAHPAGRAGVLFAVRRPGRFVLHRAASRASSAGSDGASRRPRRSPPPSWVPSSDR